MKSTPSASSLPTFSAINWNGTAMLPPIARNGMASKTNPWLLLFAFAVLLFPVLNGLDGLDPSGYSYETQDATTIAQDAQSGNSTNRALIIGLGIAGVSLLLASRNAIRVEPVILTILLGFFAWCGLSCLWSIDPTISVRRLVSFVLMSIFSAGCAVRLNARSLSIFVASTPALYLIPNVIFEIAYGRFHPFTSGFRFCGLGPHPNLEASTLSVSAILLCWLCWQSRGWLRGFFASLLFIVSLFLVLTGSRTSVMAVLAAFVFSVGLVVLRDYGRLLPVLAVSVCFVLSAAAFVSALGTLSSSATRLNVMLHRNDVSEDSDLFNGRTDLWKSLLPYVADRPLQGYGYGAFWTPQHIEEVSSDQGWVIQQSHSGYIDQLLALGIPGAALYLCLLASCLGWCVLQFLRHRNTYGSWAAVLVFVAFHSVTESISASSSFASFTFSLIATSIALRFRDLSLPAALQRIDAGNTSRRTNGSHAN